MDNPKQASLPKVVLNVTTYKEIVNEIGHMNIPMAKSIDVTDILDKNGVHYLSQIDAVSELQDDEWLPVSSRFVISEAELLSLSNDIGGIIDAAIVNEKQGKAIKKLVKDIFDQFSFKHWEHLRSGRSSDIM